MIDTLVALAYLAGLLCLGGIVLWTCFSVFILCAACLAAHRYQRRIDKGLAARPRT